MHRARLSQAQCAEEAEQRRSKEPVLEQISSARDKLQQRKINLAEYQGSLLKGGGEGGVITEKCKAMAYTLLSHATIKRTAITTACAELDTIAQENMTYYTSHLCDAPDCDCAVAAKPCCANAEKTIHVIVCPH